MEEGFLDIAVAPDAELSTMSDDPPLLLDVPAEPPVQDAAPIAEKRMSADGAREVPAPSKAPSTQAWS